MANDNEFDNFASTYDEALTRGIAISGEGKEYFARERLRWLRYRLDHLGMSPKRIMDFGCGIGTATPFIQEFFPDAFIVGVDVSEESVAIAKETFGGQTVRFETLNNCRESDFDLVFCNGVFHHIPPPERRAALDNIGTILRLGGVFALFENNPWNPGTRLVMSRIPFDRDAVTLSPLESKRMVCRLGFNVHAVDFLFFFPRFLSFFRSLESLLRAIPLGAQYLVMGIKH